jgi:hypothetical protein
MQTLCHLRPVLDIGNPGGGSYCRGHVVTPRLQAELDYLLPMWWRFKEPVWAGVEAFPSACPSARDYRTSRQYDDVNGAHDDAVDGMILEQVDIEIHALGNPHGAAIQYEARRLTIGVAVFRTWLLPQDKDELSALVSLSRDKLIERLLASGVLSR